MSVAPDQILPVFNDSMPNGGNPLEINVNLPYEGIEFHYIFQVIMGCFVFLIIPGIGMLYGGMCKRKSALSMIFQSLTVISVITVQWIFWGYTLAFSRTGSPFIGDMSNFAMKNVMAGPSWGSALIPELVFCFYELMFCGCAVMIVVGGAFERGRIIPSILFGFLWATVCYCPIAYWTWNANGWLFKFGALDFAGGGPVHMSSGAAGLAYALVLGKRRKAGELHVDKPHNVTIVFLGTCLIWFGWFGFNGGSAINASMRAMAALFNTQVAASTGCIGYSLVGYFKHGRKFSIIVACEGIIAGLVGITPAAGYVSVWSAAAIGILTAFACSALDGMHNWLRIDDGLEVFKLHGIGGACGAFLTGIFAHKNVSALDGIPTIASGAIDGVGIQVGRQLAEITSIMAYSFACSIIMLTVLKYIPALHLRVTDEVEELGIDMDQFHDEVVGEWSMFSIEENGFTHGVPSSKAGAASGSITPPLKESVATENVRVEPKVVETGTQ